jgi:1,4-alpha-glucan branching enzyme
MKKTKQRPSRDENKRRIATRAMHLEYFDAKTEAVCVAGPFNDWHPNVTKLRNDGSGCWGHDVLLEPGRYEYRLIVDGVWITDPRCPESVPNPFGARNSVLIVPPAG